MVQTSGGSEGWDGSDAEPGPYVQRGLWQKQGMFDLDGSIREF